MTDLIQLTDAEIAGVSGGILNQSIYISATQTNNATVNQTANSTTNGNTSATLSADGGSGVTGGAGGGGGATVAASGSSASNASLLAQRNSISASNRQSFHLRF